MGKARFDIKVNWVADDGFYKPTSSDERRITGISKVAVHAGTYYNSIDFETDTDYNYTFYDEAGDGYVCNVWVASWDHTVSYSSKKPTIVRVTGK